ncbi:MAG: tol-pal system protein YbgF [Deltaproteobacteria bacterium]|nr:tol-pal system protein YbgF [Deltaproteobacteria bacterium]
MRRLIIPLLLCSSGAFGCAAGAANGHGSLEQVRRLRASLEQRDARLERLEHERSELRGRDRRLRAELALARADARELRSDLEMRRRTHRIGVRESASSGGWIDEDGLAASAHGGSRASHATEEQPEESPAEPEADDGRPRPVLRLYGTPAPGPGQLSLPTATMPLGAAPFGVRAASSSTPSVAPPTVPSPDSPRASPDDAAVREYREALAMVRDRRLDQALPALERFVAAHPNHPYADNALYWRGEVFFMRHQFPQALREYARVLSTYPRGNKVADALLRTGLCHLRMGDAARARASFRRLRESYPQSVAARRASREDAS